MQLPRPTGVSGRNGIFSFQTAALAVLVVTLLVRLYNLSVFPVLRDYDGPGHALNVVALYDGHLPEPTSWAGFHPPLYHAFCALLLRVAPEALPAHVLFRLVSLGASCGVVFITWRLLRARCSPTAAAAATLTAACIPVVFIASTMVGNETTGAFFVTAVLAGLSDWADPNRPQRTGRTRILAGLATLSKATGLLVVPIVSLFHLLGGSRGPSRRIATAFFSAVIPLLFVVPFYLRVASVARISPLAVVSGGALSPDAADEMAHQPPGTRSLADYFVVPLVSLQRPDASDPALERSVTALLYASAWADPHGQYLPTASPDTRLIAGQFVILGVLPTLVGLLGVARVLRAPREHRWALPGMVFLGLILLAFLQYSWSVPRVSAVKASYLLPAFLPMAAALALGLDRIAPWLRGWVLAYLVGISLAVSLVYCLWWWA